jgi:hypothetical protein
LNVTRLVLVARTRAANAWNRFWFHPGSAEALALVRIVCCTLCFLVYARLDIRPWAAVSPAFWMPVSLFHFLPGPPQNEALLAAVQILWKASLVTSAIGFFTRFSLLTAAALGFFVLGLPNCYGKINHVDGFVVLFLLILSVSRCGDAFCMGRRHLTLPAPSGTYTWPIRIAQTLFLLIFVAAGASKLRHGGLAWIQPQNMRYLLLANMVVRGSSSRWIELIASSDVLCSLAAAATVVVELSALPAIFLPALRVPVLVALFALQTAIALLMGIYFLPHLAGYALFVPWDRLYRKSTAIPNWLRSIRTSRARSFESPR